MSALSFYFKNRYGNVRVVGVQPASGEVIPGIRRVETGMKWIHMVEFDEIVDVTLEEAVRSSISIARREGLLAGLSSGAVVKAFLNALVAVLSGWLVRKFARAGWWGWAGARRR